MKTRKNLRIHSTIGGLVFALALAAAAPSARANVFASNVKINGGMTNISVAQGTSVNISYILNEPASAGVTIKIFSGTTVVRTMTFASGTNTTRGLNTVTWDGKADSGTDMPGGNYSISIKASSTGYAGWTKITDDNNIGNYSWEARGIAVDRNTNSPYYGRVFVGNASPGPGSANGDLVGIQKLNADGSNADEGAFSDGGIAWRGGYVAPWKIRVSDDDCVYVEDWFNAGDLYRFDGTISSNSMLPVFSAPADGSLGSWSGFQVVGRGTNTVLWAADANYSIPSVGISKFFVKPDGTFDATAGTNVVGLGGSPGLDLYPYAVDLDKAGAIYTLQHCVNQGDTRALVLRFPAYDPSTNGGAPEYTADWVAGPGDDYCGGNGIVVDPTGTYVAAAFWGYGSDYTSGNIKILKAADGTILTNLDLGVSYTNRWTDDPTHHMDTDCDWDAVGNLYYLDNWGICWRAFSPPGVNQATTVALATVQVIGSVVPPYVQSIAASGGMVIIHFTGGSNDPPWVFSLLSSAVVNGAYAPATGATITGSGGSFQATVPMNGPVQFYRIMRSGTILPHITGLNVAGGSATITFTGAPADGPSAFTLLRSAAVNGYYSMAVGASVTQLSPGLFQATVATNGPQQFYRIRR